MCLISDNIQHIQSGTTIWDKINQSVVAEKAERSKQYSGIKLYNRYLTASLLDDLMMSLAVGTPTRLKVMPCNESSVTYCNWIISYISNRNQKETYSFVFHVAELVLLFPLVETDADSSPTCSACTTWSMDVRLHILRVSKQTFLGN